MRLKCATLVASAGCTLPIHSSLVTSFTVIGSRSPQLLDLAHQ